MAVPKSKISRSKRGMRRAHDGITSVAVSVCPHSGKTHRRHHLGEDGTYRGKPIFEDIER